MTDARLARRDRLGRDSSGRARWTRIAGVALIASLGTACRCGNTPRSADAEPAVPTPRIPEPPPALPPAATPTHVEVPAAAAIALTALRADLARGSSAIAPHLARTVRLETPTRMTGPDPERTVAYLRRFPDVLVAIAIAIDRGCAGELADEQPHARSVTCPAEALDDDYGGVVIELSEEPGQGWRIASLTAAR